MTRKNIKTVWCIIIIVVALGLLLGCNTEGKEHLSMYIEQSEVYAADKYTPGSYAVYKLALDEAKALPERALVSRAQLEDARHKLQQAIDDLVLKPDKTKLVQKCKEMRAMDLSTYTPRSVERFVEMVEAAEAVQNDENSTNEKVNSVLLELEGCGNVLEIKADKTKLSAVMQKAESLNKEKYTTVSYNVLDDSRDRAHSILNNEDATQAEVESAISDINNNIKRLVKATECVVILDYNLYMESNNSVGNEWYESVTYQGTALKHKQEVTVPIGTDIIIKAKVIEDDSIPDIGGGSISLKSGESDSETTKIIVRENRGRYSGHTAVWKLYGSVTVLERK